MAVLYIAEFDRLATGGNGEQMQVGRAPPVAEQTVAIGAEAKSSAFSGSTYFVRVHADAICSIKITGPGVTPTATTAMMRLAANQTEYFGVHPGGKLSVISNT